MKAGESALTDFEAWRLGMADKRIAELERRLEGRDLALRAILTTTHVEAIHGIAESALNPTEGGQRAED